jgi:hypothetical protein
MKKKKKKKIDTSLVEVFLSFVSVRIYIFFFGGYSASRGEESESVENGETDLYLNDLQVTRWAAHT